MTNKKERQIETLFVGSDRHVDLSRIVALFVNKIQEKEVNKNDKSKICGSAAGNHKIDRN